MRGRVQKERSRLRRGLEPRKLRERASHPTRARGIGESEITRAYIFGNRYEQQRIERFAPERSGRD